MMRCAGPPTFGCTHRRMLEGHPLRALWPCCQESEEEEEAAPAKPAAKKAKKAEAPAAAAGGEEEGTSIFVKNLPWKATEDDVAGFFGECGEVTSVRIGALCAPAHPDAMGCTGSSLAPGSALRQPDACSHG